MGWKQAGTCVAILMGVLAVAVPAHAIGFDFSTLANPVGHSVTVNGVTATAWDPYDPLGLNPSLLWVRNLPGDHGLGVCDYTTIDCVNAGGDINEVDNIDGVEAIRLEKPNGTHWTSLWVSSLDSGGTGGAETGTIFWSDSADFTGAPSFTFSFGIAGASVEFDLLGVGLQGAAGWTGNHRYLLFVAGDGTSTGENNDYLVWKGVVEVPEPATLALLGAGLVSVALAARRRRP